MKRAIDMTSAGTVGVRMQHTSSAVTRFSNSRIVSSDDGDKLEISIRTEFGGQGRVWVSTNQLDDSALRAAVQQCEALARERVGMEESVYADIQFQDTYLPVDLWHDTTAQAMATARETVVPELISAVTREGLGASGFLGLMARASATLSKAGVTAFCDETDSEVTVTARSKDGKAVGWAGHAARDWSTVPYPAVAAKAVETAKMSEGVRALEPGRRTAILSPAALVQMARFFAAEFDAFATDIGETTFSRGGNSGNRLHQRVVDKRISMFSDPADPMGGFPNFFNGINDGYATPAVQWIENGVLKNLCYDPSYAMGKGKAYSARPASIHMTGGTTTIPEMIAACEEGIYVNRFFGVELIDKRTGMMTGSTSGGCFLVKDGKIKMPVKNFQILDSPFLFMNRILALGPAERAAFGSTPYAFYDSGGDWPRPPMIMPPMMVSDFNFSAMVDAV